MDRIFSEIIKGRTKVRIVVSNTTIDLKSKNSIDCEVLYVDTGKIVEATVQTYPTRALAERYIDILSKVKSDFLAYPLFALTGADGQGLAFVERLLPVHTVLNANMWKTDRAGRVDFSPVALDVLEQILHGLEKLHHEGYRHGNLLAGIHFGPNNKVHLSNFDPGLENLSEADIICDLLAVKNFFKLASREHPPPNRQTSKIDLFYDFFDFQNFSLFKSKEDARGPLLRAIARFIYQLRLMWNPTSIALMFTFLSGLRPHPMPTTRTIKHKFFDSLDLTHSTLIWATPMTFKDQFLYDVYWHNGNEKKGAPSSRYLTNGAAIHLARHSMQHIDNGGYNAEVGARHLLDEFPTLSLLCYFAILKSSKLLDQIMVDGVLKNVHEFVYQNIITSSL